MSGDAGENEENVFNDELQDFDDEPEDGESLFGNDMERDYRDQPELDVLSGSGIDDNDAYSDISPSARREAEMAMADRDQLLDDGQLFYEEGDDTPADVRRRRSDRDLRDFIDDDEDEDAVAETHVDVLEIQRDRAMSDHVRDEAVRKEIERRFKRFLRHFKDDNQQEKYVRAIKEMAAHNRESIEVEFADLASDQGEVNICWFLPEVPMQVFKYLDHATTQVVIQMFPWYTKVTPSVAVRVRGLPIEEDIRSLRQIHLNTLIKTTGVITVTTGILPQLTIAKYDCEQCAFIIGPFTQTDGNEQRPTTCPMCQSRGPFKLNSEHTVYHNYQRVTIQESPNLVAAGRLPRSKDVVLTGDLCDACKPGDIIELTGVYTASFDGSMNNKQGFPVFGTQIFANHIARRDQLESAELTDEDVRICRELSRDPQIAQRIYASLAPTIYGHENIKEAIALALFRGEPKNPDGKHAVRGDINVLLCGDPGTAKSQFLRYVSHVAPRSVMTTGQGASSVGLTAYVQRHPVTRQWTLEAGAMVLADKGVCLIDEFDKMKEHDRTSIHEAMEQQSISVSKAGIVTSLQARCTVIAAANPIGGSYDSSRTFAENVQLTEPIISRFDILCVVRDNVDPVEDDLLANFVIGNHRRMHPEAVAETAAAAAGADADTQPTVDAATLVASGASSGMPQRDALSGVELIPHSILRKYIAYARDTVHPKLNINEDDHIPALYASLRDQSVRTGSVPITVRNIESLIRIAEAHAKLHLRSYVSKDDVKTATRIMLECFVGTQKKSVMNSMKNRFKQQLTFKRDYNELLMYALKELMRQERSCHGDASNVANVAVRESTLLDKAKKFNIRDLSSFYQSQIFRNNCFDYDAQHRLIRQAV